MLAQDTQNKANATKTAEKIHQTSHVKEPLMHTVPAPLDEQYDVPAQMRKPLIHENRTDKDDIINIYNPNKHLNNIGNYQKKDKSNKSLK